MARLLRARGNKGELAAQPLTNQPDRVKHVLVNRVPMEIESTWMHGDLAIFKFKGVDSISDAERLAGADVAIPMEQRAEVPEGEYYQSDLLGCQVTDASGRLLGTVTDFQETGGTPLLEVTKADGKELLIPFAKAICMNIDMTEKRIAVNLPEGLEDL
ncbi:MAG TPA: ribosome maturation factor RimM [Bryobacteraceae bacterium]|nr:ribosome maturation factor RimM [Bryobacteraceae bacterium]